MKITYDVVILLCASKLDDKGKFEEVKDNLYIGGQVRMEAAVDLAPNVKNYIVVGGDEEKISGMKKFLQEQIEKRNIEIPPIIRVESDADTNGNLWAIKRCLIKYGKSFKDKKIGILTNFYHLPRATSFAMDILPDTKFLPIAAEAVLKQHESTYALWPLEFSRRISSEINGLSDWESGNYKNQHKPETEFKAQCHDHELFHNLFIATG